MFRYLIIFTVLLSLQPALGSSNETVPKPEALSIRQILNMLNQLYSNCTQPQPVATHIYDDEELTKIQHQMKLLKIENRNLRDSIEIINGRMERRLTEIWNEINSLSGIPNEIKSLSGIANEIQRRLHSDNSTYLGCEKRNKGAYPTSCLKLTGGLQQIQIDRFSPDPFFVYCDNVTQGGGWTVIQRRMDGSVDFDRNWTDYKQGFGSLAGEFFIGLDKLYALTTTSANELLIVMRYKDGEERFAKYEAFAIGSENEQYALNIVGTFSGNAGDALSYLQSGRFYTKDKEAPYECKNENLNGWWQQEDDCWSGLNGNYGDSTFDKGLNWQSVHGYEYSLPYVQMMIRPRSQ